MVKEHEAEQNLLIDTLVLTSKKWVEKDQSRNLSTRTQIALNNPI